MLKCLVRRPNEKLLSS